MLLGTDVMAAFGMSVRYKPKTVVTVCMPTTKGILLDYEIQVARDSVSGLVMIPVSSFDNISQRSKSAEKTMNRLHDMFGIERINEICLLP